MSYSPHGTGTTNAMTKWTGANTVGDSNETDDGTTFTAGKRVAFTPVTKTFTGTQNDYDVGDAVVIRLVASTVPIITGLANGTNGRLIRLISDPLSNSEDISLPGQDTGSLAANRFSRNAILAPGYAIDLVYDGANNLWVPSAALSGSGTPGTMPIWSASSSILADGPIKVVPAFVGNDVEVDDSFAGGVNSFSPLTDDTITLGNSGNRWKIAIPSQYDSVPVAGKGIVPIHDVVQLTGQTAAIINTAFVNGNTPGLYRASYYLLSYRDGSGGSAVDVTFGWTDAQNARTFTSVSLPLDSSGYIQGTVFIQQTNPPSPNDISYATTYASDGTYDLYLTLEKLSD